ncbi:MAG: hypothetical protein Q9170_006353 [Blastenia crenularia]
MANLESMTEKEGEGGTKSTELRYADLHSLQVGINLTDSTYRGFYNHHSQPSHPTDIPHLLHRASSVGVQKYLITGSDLEQSVQAIELSKQYPGSCYATVGVHPCSAKKFERANGGGEEMLGELREVAETGMRQGWVKAFGEIGLDFDRLMLSGREAQERWFGRQLEVAVELQLPLFLHSRAAHTAFLSMLKPHLSRLPRRGLVHSFTGTISEMCELIELGFHIGINGCSLKTEANLEVVKEVPLDRLQLETDGPWCEIRATHAGTKYLKEYKEPFKKVKKEKWEEGAGVKGRNEPAEIVKVAWVVAGVKGVRVEEVVEAAWRNSVGMFELGCEEEEGLLDLGCRGSVIDTRLSIYLDALLVEKIVDVSTLLCAVQPFPLEDEATFDPTLLDADSAKLSLQTMVLQLLTRTIANEYDAEDYELFLFMKNLIPWMTMFPSSVTLGFLVSATLGCHEAQRALPVMEAKSPTELKASFGRSLTPFIANLSQTNIQLASTLNYWQKHYQLHDELPAEPMDLLNGVDLGALSFEQSVLDNELLNTRAGLYIYLNSLGNVPTLVTDLILASFDILANAMYRTEPAQAMTILRSFLVNKLPPFLNNYAAVVFPPLTIEACISQALLRIDPAAFPSFSQMFDLLGKNGMLSEARQEFLFACALHQLIPEGSIEGLLGDVPMQSLPASGRYVKNDLVAQCTANPARIDELIAELENMEGNAGEIADALVERLPPKDEIGSTAIITTLCSNNDTMTLKCICNSLIRSSATLDTISLFCSPQTLLQPMCQLLDNWQEHEDQAENQPVYDEFGSVLLLVCTIYHRFDLDLADLGVLDHNLFISRYFRFACESRAIDRLTDHENELLGGWIRGLFEAEGINDELMSMCQPAEFHLLVATLFDQSIKACQARVLTLETLTGGFECTSHIPNSA